MILMIIMIIPIMTMIITMIMTIKVIMNIKLVLFLSLTSVVNLYKIWPRIRYIIDILYCVYMIDALSHHLFQGPHRIAS